MAQRRVRTITLRPGETVRVRCRRNRMATRRVRTITLRPGETVRVCCRRRRCC